MSLRDNAAIILTLIGAAIYADLRVAYYFFYSRMDVSPEEVGLSYVAILASSAVGLLLMVLIIGLIGSVLGAMYYWGFVLASHIHDRRKGRVRAAARRCDDPQQRVIACLIAFESLKAKRIAEAKVSDLSPADAPEVLRVARYLGPRKRIKLSADTAPAVKRHLGSRAAGPLLIEGESPLSVEQISAFRMQLLADSKTLSPESAKSRSPLHRRLKVFARLVIAAFLATLIVVTLYWIPHTASDAGKRPLRGESVDAVTLGKLAWFSLLTGHQLAEVPVLAVRAAPATVTWTAGNVPDGLRNPAICLMYLGQTDGTTVLYDWRVKHSIRVPTNIVVVTLLRQMPDNCQPPTY